jgi:hypothetical protein
MAVSILAGCRQRAARGGAAVDLDVEVLTTVTCSG